MWVLYGVLPPLVILAVLVGGAILLFRGRGADGWNIEFSGVLLAYVAVAMLVGVFLTASGAALLAKAGLAGAVERDFSYQEYHSRYQSYPDRRYVDQAAIDRDNDIAAGVSMAFIGAVVFGVHALGSAVLRRRGAQGVQLVTRGYNLVGLAVATIGFLGTGAIALNDVVRRYLLDSENLDQWQLPHPGEPIAFASVLLPLALWFGWRVWQEMGGEGALSRQSGAPASGSLATGSL